MVPSEALAAASTCPLRTSLPHSVSEALTPGGQPEIRAYKLGKKRWSYNQVELRLSGAGAGGTADPRLALQQAVFTADAVFPAGCEDSAVSFNLQLQTGHKLVAHLYVVFDRLGCPQPQAKQGSTPKRQQQRKQQQGSGSSASSSSSSPLCKAEGEQAGSNGGAGAGAISGGNSDKGSATGECSDGSLSTWHLVTRSHCCKGCKGCILRPIQRFGRLGKRSWSDSAAPAEVPTLGSPRGASGSMKDPKFMYVSIDEACTHVDAGAFRLVAGIYDSTAARLLTTAVSPPIRVLANNDVPTGAARIPLDAELPEGWEALTAHADACPAQPATAAAVAATPRRAKRSCRSKAAAQPSTGSPGKPASSIGSGLAPAGASAGDNVPAGAATPAGAAAADTTRGDLQSSGVLLSGTLRSSTPHIILVQSRDLGQWPPMELQQQQQQPVPAAAAAVVVAAVPHSSMHCPPHSASWPDTQQQPASASPTTPPAGEQAAPSPAGACLRTLTLPTSNAASPLVPLSLWQAAPQQAHAPVAKAAPAAAGAMSAVIAPAGSIPGLSSSPTEYVGCAPASQPQAATWGARTQAGPALATSTHAACPAGASSAAPAADISTCTTLTSDPTTGPTEGSGSGSLIALPPELTALWQQHHHHHQQQVLLQRRQQQQQQQAATAAFGRDQLSLQWGSSLLGSPPAPSPTDSDASAAVHFQAGGAAGGAACCGPPGAPKSLAEGAAAATGSVCMVRLRGSPVPAPAHTAVAEATQQAGPVQDWHMNSMAGMQCSISPPSQQQPALHDPQAGQHLHAGHAAGPDQLWQVQGSAPALPAPPSQHRQQQLQEDGSAAQRHQAALLKYSEAQLVAAQQAAVCRASCFAAAMPPPSPLLAGQAPPSLPGAALPPGASSAPVHPAAAPAPAAGGAFSQWAPHPFSLMGPGSTDLDHLLIALGGQPCPSPAIPAPAAMPPSLFDGMASIFDDVPGVPCL